MLRTAPPRDASLCAPSTSQVCAGLHASLRCPLLRTCTSQSRLAQKGSKSFAPLELLPIIVP